MLVVRIYVGHELVESGTALRIEGGTNPNDMNTYLLNDQSTIKHRYGDGAAALAEKICKHLAQSSKRVKRLKNDRLR